jgi:hypothetical protein
MPGLAVLWTLGMPLHLPRWQRFDLSWWEHSRRRLVRLLPRYAGTVLVDTVSRLLPATPPW